jgi:5-methyltetrahydropteroyltriglutamate--homocysteine methyltransferase
MQRSSERILTTHAGRLPFPSTMDALGTARANGDETKSADLIAQGVAEVVRRQVESGVDVVSDGEFYKSGFLDYGYYEPRVTGVEQRPRQPDEQLWFGDRAPEILDPRFHNFFAWVEEAGMFPDAGSSSLTRRALPPTHRLVIAGPLEYLGQDAIRAELAAALAGLEAAGVSPENVFYPQFGPGWLGHFLWNEYYGSDEEYVHAMAEAWRGEYEAIVEAGFILQLDDPGLADKFYMFNPPLSIEDYRKQAEIRIEATNHALRNIPEDRVRYHTCWGSWHYPHTRDLALEHIVDLMLKVKAQAYSIEAANVRHQLDYKVWENVKLPEGKLLIPGVIAHTTSNLVEAPELVADRLITYGKLVGRENVMAGTDCGLGARCHDDVAWAKLESMARGAELASKALWAT